MNVGKTAPVEVRIGSRLLVTSDIQRFPTEEEIKTLVDDFGK
jgi:hypothetical protein